MKDTGLREKEIKEIVKVLMEHKEVEEAFIFGSRAKGNYKKGSDIDIAIKGENVTLDIVAKILTTLEDETILPYFFDVIHYETCSNKELIEHIDRVGVCIYQKEAN